MKENTYIPDPSVKFESGLVNYQNYGIFVNLLKGEQVYINTEDIVQNTWNDYFTSLHNILLDGIETDLVQYSKINISFDNKITVRLSLFDLWINLIMWRLLIYTNQKIRPKHIFFPKYVTKKTLKKFIDEFCIEVNKRNIPNPILNGIISDCLTEISKIDEFSFYLANTFNLEDFYSLMRQNNEFYNLMHPNLENVPLEDVKIIGNKNTEKMIDIMNNEKIHNPSGKDYKHCLAIPLAIGEGVNAKQFREFAVVEGTKPNNEGGIFPHAIETSFITGGISDPYDYYMDANAARIAQILQKENVGTSGRFARLLGLNNIDTFLHPDPNFDCHTKNYIELQVSSERILKMIDSRFYRMTLNGVDHLIRADKDTHLIGKTILLRSPVTCASAARGEGICYKCYGELAYVNKDINPGRYASEKLSAELTQRLLSAKHLLETVIKKIIWCKEFYDFMDINSNCITLNQDLVIGKGYFMLIDPEDIDFENEDIEELEEEDIYSEYVSRFYIKTPSGEEILIKSETDDKLYLSNTLNGLIRKEAIQDNGRFALPLSKIKDEPLFFIVLHNNDLMKALEDVKDCIDKNDITRGRGMTKDKLVNKFINTIIISNLSIQSVHLEVILMNQIRDLDNVLEKPHWEYPNADYQILTMKQALDKNPSVVISLLNEKLEKMFYMPLTYKKTAPSFVDLFFMEQPQMFINNDSMIDGTVEYKDYSADDGINKKLISPVKRLEVESEE